MERETNNENSALFALNNMFQCISPEQRGYIKSLTENELNIASLLKDRTQFIASNRFLAHNSGKIEYIGDEINSSSGKLKFLHELAHKILKHSGEESDKANLENERVAWLYAVEGLKKLDIVIDNKLATDIINFFDTYKKHLEKRSVCIACGSKNSEEFTPQNYTCKDCYCDW